MISYDYFQKHNTFLFKENIEEKFQYKNHPIALAKRLDICTEHALDKCPVQNAASFCHLVQSCPILFSRVQRCSVDFEGSQKYSVDKIKFLLFEENVQWFCHPTEHCPVCASALQMQQWTVFLAPAPFYFLRLRFSKESIVIAGKKWSHQHQLVP